jgi:hypothetical protein
VAKNDNRPAGLTVAMAPPPSFDGEYELDSHSGPGILSIQGKRVQYTGRDGKRRQVVVKSIDRTHLTFSVIEDDGGRQAFDGFLTAQNDIAGTTSFHGSYSTSPEGFTATRIKRK